MFESFTDRAKRVIVLAQEEARTHNHNYIGTEHILLGLVHEGEGVGARALELLRIAQDEVRNQVDEIIGEGDHTPVDHIPFTPRAKKVLELSLREALLLGHGYLGTEHILLGLIREGEGLAAQVLVKLGADLNNARQHVLLLVSGYARSALTTQLAAVAKARAAAIEQRDTARVAKLLGLENCLQSLVELDNKILSVQQDKFSAHDSSQALELREQEEALRKQRAELDELRELVTHEVDLEPEDTDDEESPSAPTDNNEPPPSPLIRVFISYRREHTSHFAGRISDWLIGHLGENQVFMDVDSIELGVDFKEVITDAVGQCDLLVAVIGPQWATMCDESGKRRLTQPDDIVRLEVEAALRRNIRVIPVLVDGAEMPDTRQLPESLAALTRRNALKVRHESFRQDVRRLLQAVEKPH